MLGQPGYKQESILIDFARRVPIAGKAIVEIGGCVDPSVVRRLGVREWLAIDPTNEPGPQCDFHRSVRARGSDISVEAAHFDHAFSSNAFEHIHDLDATLREVARVLKPGGYLFAHFGPIWSAPDGHHLETTVGGREYTFWRDCPIPLWSHLALTEPEMTKLLLRSLPAAEAHALADFVYRSRDLNRLSYEDYLEAFLRCGMHLTHLETSGHLDYPFTSPVDGDDSQFREQARERLGHHSNVDCRDMLVVLCKP